MYEKICEYDMIFGNAMEKPHFSRVKKVRGLNFIIGHREQFALRRIWAPGKPRHKSQNFV